MKSVHIEYGIEYCIAEISGNALVLSELFNLSDGNTLELVEIDTPVEV